MDCRRTVGLWAHVVSVRRNEKSGSGPSCSNFQCPIFQGSVLMVALHQCFRETYVRIIVGSGISRMPLGPWPTAAECPDLGHIENDTRAKTRIYGLACMCAHLLKSINPSSRWKDRFKTEVQDFQIQKFSIFRQRYPYGLRIKQIFGIETVRLGMIPLRWVFYIRRATQ